MKDVFLERFNALKNSQWVSCLSGITRGIEKESLRVNQHKGIAKTAHPLNLGASLTHPFITTDYSEALLEFVTPPTDNIEKPLNDLRELHQYTHHILSNEVLWAGSMPCLLPKRDEDIPIAQYGTSNIGLMKNIYRRGLGYRYGRKMQTISGIHYNFSLPMLFWENYHQLLESNQDLNTFISEQYLGIVRNSLRLSWIFPLLLGASPAIDRSFFNDIPSDLILKNNTLIGNEATSLRLSDFGYHNKAQSQMTVSYNSLSEFIGSMQRCVHTSVPEYEKIGVKVSGEYRQLSDCFFQVEDEHYGLIRPKRVALPEERMLKAVMHQGIEYLEVRAIDNNPFSPIGIEPETIYVLDAFLLMCLLLDSPVLLEMENKQIRENFLKIVKEGRGLALALGNPLMRSLKASATLLDNAYQCTLFSEACENARKRVLEGELPSQKVASALAEYDGSYIDFTWDWSLKHHDYFLRNPLDSSRMDYYHRLSMDSLAAAKRYEADHTISFDAYLKQYLSE